ncbi:hypothetical protein F8388_017756 [Cannabis sativa]|uniref:Glycosyl transferase CAP10 domain-containing protein n=2 Tax=Cannabis sativa TaxID=3483 RepID=A0A7J6E5F4_CANSA|nr:hypothetical protein F8388_017756 [Cannabis sativa]
MDLNIPSKSVIFHKPNLDFAQFNGPLDDVEHIPNLGLLLSNAWIFHINGLVDHKGHTIFMSLPILNARRAQASKGKPLELKMEGRDAQSLMLVDRQFREARELRLEEPRKRSMMTSWLLKTARRWPEACPHMRHELCSGNDDKLLIFATCLVEVVWKCKNEYLFQDSMPDVKRVLLAILKGVEEYGNALLDETSSLEQSIVDVIAVCASSTFWDMRLQVDASVLDGLVGTRLIQCDVDDGVAITLMLNWWRFSQPCNLRSRKIVAPCSLSRTPPRQLRLYLQESYLLLGARTLFLENFSRYSVVFMPCVENSVADRLACLAKVKRFCARKKNDIFLKESLSSLPFRNPHPPQNQTKINIPINCTTYGIIASCPSNYSTAYNPNLDQDHPLSPTCPDYFRWIYEDLKPWAQTGVTKDMVEKAETMSLANFRLVIVKGKAYVEFYRHSFQSRDIFTLWGILQLLRRYPGRVPDLDLMFNCGDLPIVQPEIDIKPWVPLLKEIKEGNKKKNWMKRKPYAYWKGNPGVSLNRQDLFKCKASPLHDWKARLYAQDWDRAARRGYKKSNLAKQCTHRFKIYIEGNAWSVSHKYILSCNSVTLTVKPRYYDFFARALIPRHHYWPIKAQKIGERGSKFIEEELKMEYVYDFMLNILTEYAKLLTYKPTIPPRATELCSEAMACEANGLAQEFMMESMERSPTHTIPCTMPPPYNVSSLASFLEKKNTLIKEVELWETYSR